ncbi:MAG TPA: putative molybdenum carrier protein [Candidatus Saccharimonadales bacterium]|nr:putative molybdenum carrier protein [Candidatus Saccharimonadales bacterium]
MPDHFISEIVSGGQTGVDRAALDVSIEFGIPHGGWCPYGRAAEDGVIPKKYNLKEAPAPIYEKRFDPDAIYKKRTELNAKDSDGTLIILKDEPMGGTLYTIQMAKKYEKPFLIFNVSDGSKITDIAIWIIKNDVHKINIAGPRASQEPDIYSSTLHVLRQVMNDELLNQNKNTFKIRSSM